ncbi:MAG: hypothetical protein OEM15_11150 [Myxococcales bacterium]|nr:hypothetical protein [Myxococcales bacterium]MDH3483165.1 hypothetical protein [Myxococcales bacterium]
MTWTTRGFPSALCALLVASACGDPDADLRGTTVTVFVPSGPNATVSDDFALTWSLEYIIVCGSGLVGASGEAVTFEGTLEQAEAFKLGEDGLSAVWKGRVELPAGPCTIQLRLRDADGEVICTGTQELTIEPETPNEAYVSLVCNGSCPTIPLPDSEAAPKLSCAPVGGVLLSAETPADLETVQSIDYVMTQATEGFLDGYVPEPYEGSLVFAGPGAADLGGGRVVTDVWEATVGVVIADNQYVLELTALDAEGEPICSAGKTVQVVANSIAQIHIILPCSN